MMTAPMAIHAFVRSAGRFVAGLLLMLPLSLAHGSMQEIADTDLGDVTGQAMFLADKIQGVGTADGNAYNEFTFYRVALDANLAMNMNINKLQLGCGGFNEGLVANACDVDLDFASFMGTGGTGSDFVLSRPYMELAIKNDADKTKREVVGLKIGTAAADGLLSIGRTYANGVANLENPTPAGLCNAGSAVAVDNGVRLACHSGANRFSGFLFGEMSGYAGVTSSFGNAQACFGIINAPNGCNSNTPLWLAVAGTRMSDLLSVGQTLKLTSCTGLLAFIGCPSGFADIRESYRFLHQIVLTDTGAAPRVSRDFFIAFQRERVSYPIFDQGVPYETNGFGTGNKTYSATANTGWWMNLTYAAALGLNAGTMDLPGLTALDALNEGANAGDINLGQIPADNCYGAAKFC